MKPLTITDPDIILGLQDEIRRSEESRYDHRLHGLLLVAQGLSCRGVAQLLGDSPRAVQYWVNRFEKDGLAAKTPLSSMPRSAKLMQPWKDYWVEWSCFRK